MYYIACCKTINIVLGGDVKTIQGIYEGLYNYTGTFNDRNYWVKLGGGQVLWYYPKWNGWTVGSKDEKGFKGIYAYSHSICPNNSKNNWQFYNNGWISTNDIVLDCK